MKSSSHILIFSLPFLLDHLRLSSQETPTILNQLAWDPRYTASGRIQQKTAFPNNSSVVTEVCLPRRCIDNAILFFVRCHFCRNLFTESLSSNKRLFWLRYSSLHAPCHIILPCSTTLQARILCPVQSPPQTPQSQQGYSSFRYVVPKDFSQSFSVRPYK
jgi:hypothetical protein